MITIAGQTFDWLDAISIVLGVWAIRMLWKLFKPTEPE